MTKHKFGCEYSITFRRVNDSDIKILKEFDCGNRNINECVRKCLTSQKDVSYLFLDNENNQIIGFSAICCSGILVDQVSEIDGELKNISTSLPSVEIDFFAVDERYRSLPFDSESNRYETLSSMLLLFMIMHIQDITQKTIGATHICLYSVPKAKSFYKRCGFEEFQYYMKRDEAIFTKGCIPMFMSIQK